MASQTKVEPVERAAPAGVPTADGSQAAATGGSKNDGSENEKVSHDGGSGDRESQLGDDEDVSFDELMISDSNDNDDEPEEATDVHTAPRSADAEPAKTQHADAEQAEQAAQAMAEQAMAEQAHAEQAMAEQAEQAMAEQAHAEQAAAEQAGLPEESLPEPARDLLEDDEAASRAAAAAAQEVAAQAAAAPTASLQAALAAREAGAEEEATEPAPVSMTLDVDDLEPDSMYDVSARFTSQEADAAADSSLDRAVMAGVEAQREAIEAETPAALQASSPADRDDDFAEDTLPPAGVTPVSQPPRIRRPDAPLPSFDIPEVEAAAGPSGGPADAKPATESRPSSRSSSRLLVAPLAPLSEAAEEDDDDAVTHIGLPVPEAANDYPFEPGGFQVADPGIAPLTGFDADMSPTDVRRATTRIIQRFHPSQVESRRREVDTGPGATGSRTLALRAWWSRTIDSMFGARSSDAGEARPGRERFSWFFNNALPSLSLVVFGSGIGAVIMLLQPDGVTDVAQHSQTVQALKEASPTQAVRGPTTLIERAEAGEGDALFKITNMPADERTSALTLALERGYQTQKLNEFDEFARALDSTEAAAPPNLMGRFVGYATSPQTMLPAFQRLAESTGPRGPEILYAVWEKAPGGSRAASLAQQLLQSADQRSKEAPALRTVLDLRAATTCEDYQRLLPAVLRDGDQRCSATLRALKHTDGCGDDGQQDCYACLRENSLLDDALAAVENRQPPQF